MAGGLQSAVLDTLNDGIVVVSGEGCVLFANRTALRMDQNGSLTLGDWRTCFGVGSPSQTQRLRHIAWDAARGGTGGSLRLEGIAPEPALAVTISPLPRPIAATTSTPLTSTTGAALVVVSQIRSRDAPSTKLLMEVFSLTRAEATIVRYLLTGLGAAEIAASRGVSALTVRSQIRQILAKTAAPNLRLLPQ